MTWPHIIEHTAIATPRRNYWPPPIYIPSSSAPRQLFDTLPDPQLLDIGAMPNNGSPSPHLISGPLHNSRHPQFLRHMHRANHDRSRVDSQNSINRSNIQYIGSLYICPSTLRTIVIGCICPL